MGWDYDVKLFEDGPPILKIVMARDMGKLQRYTKGPLERRGAGVR